MSARFALLTIRNGVACCLMIAAAALLAVDAIGPVHALILAGAILHGRWAARPLLPARAWDALAVVALIAFPLDLLLISQHLIGSALRLLTFVVLYRCANLTEHRDLRQAVALSFVQLLAAAASTTESWFGLFLAAYLFMAIWTLMAMASARDGAPGPLRRAPGGRPAAAATTFTVMAGSLFFIAIPHFGTGYFQAAGMRGSGDPLSGFSDRIELGSINRIRKNRAIVMRVRVHGVDEPAFLPLRWRGVAFDTFDGRSWSLSRAARRWVDRDPDGSFHVGQPLRKGQKPLDHQISMMPLMVPVLFTSPGATRVVIDSVPSMGVDEGGALHLPQPPLSRFTYRVVSPAPGHALGGYGLDSPPPSTGTHLLLPRADARIAGLAREVTAGASSDFERARRIEDHLRATHVYSLDVDDAGVADPLARFLLEKKPGHCEYFATAMAVLLRYNGIPSRVVNGFQSGEWSPITESFIVRQSDAHAWVEAWITSRGWVTFDPTPLQEDLPVQAGLLARWQARVNRLELLWDTWVVGLDLLDQQSLAASMFDVMAAGFQGAAAAAAAAGNFVSAMAQAGWPAAVMTGCVALSGGGLVWMAARLRRGGLLRRRRRRGAGLSPRARRAHAAFAAFEARWARRGLRRAAGQTPRLLAERIERAGAAPSGQAIDFVRAYYRERFGP
jgi:hypothetical protein